MAEKFIQSPKEWVVTDGVDGGRGVSDPVVYRDEPTSDNPVTFKGTVDIKGDLYVQGKKYEPAVDELPPTTDASAGNVLKLDSNKKPQWDVDESVPGTSSATAGQVLKLNNQKQPTWMDDSDNELPSLTGNAGKVLKVNSGATGVEWDTDSGMLNPMTTADDLIVGGTDGVPERLAKGSNGDLLRVNSNGQVAYGKSLPYATTAPSAANTDGLKIVVLDSEPATYYNGYFYIITESVE